MTTHSFRHTHCTLVLESQKYTIQQVIHRLGHKDIKVTLEVYTRVTAESMEKNADMYVEYLNQHSFYVAKQ
nr:tyrosine-type recombinase/integrase [Lysinibacillus sp. A1]